MKVNLFLVLPLVGTAKASTISVGSPDATPSLARCIPFTCAFDYGAGEYQQVYTNTAFSGPFSISQISFTLDTMHAGNATEPATFDIYLSTTSKSVGGLDTNLSLNEGADKQLFGSFSLSGTVPDVLTFTGAPFPYDPSQGNLLMDVVFTSSTYNNAALAYFMYTTPDGLTSRAWTSSGGGFAQNAGAFTTFGDPPSTAPSTGTPEPSTMGLLGIGIGGVLLGARTNFGRWAGKK